MLIVSFREPNVLLAKHMYTPPMVVLVWKTPELVRWSTVWSDPSDRVNSLLASSREALGLRVFWILGDERSSVLLGLLASMKFA